MPKNCTDAPVYTTYTRSRPGHHAKNGQRPGHHAKNGQGRVITQKRQGPGHHAKNGQRPGHHAKKGKARVITQIADEEREGLQGADWDEADAEAAPKTTFGLKDFGKR